MDSLQDTSFISFDPISRTFSFLATSIENVGVYFFTMMAEIESQAGTFSDDLSFTLHITDKIHVDILSSDDDPV
jgi:hypothetical protein